MHKHRLNTTTPLAFRKILNYRLTTVRSDTTIIDEINAAERNHIGFALKHLTEKPLLEKRPLFLYRGDSKKNLRRQQFGRKQEPWHTDDLLFSMLFYFGQKARHFWLEHGDDIAKRDWLTSIDDASDATFSWIFDRIGVILKYKFVNVQQFVSGNPSFAAYFLDQGNKRDFISKAASLNLKDRQHAKDYYLYFAHTFGRKGIHESTMLVSASSDIKVASSFRKHQEENLVSYLFVPPPHYRYCISSHFFSARERAAMVMGTPSYAMNSGLYPNQKEFSLRGAIFPHFLLGVHDPSTEQFVVNPHLLAMRCDDLASLPSNGIRIDQSEFGTHVLQTGFFRYGVLSPDGIYQGYDRA